VTRRKWPWILSGIAAALVLLLGGGAFAAFQALKGGGAQPESVVPADTVAFAKLDLNPSAAQKVAAVRFMNRIPGVGDAFAQNKDPRRSVFDLLARSGSLPAGLSFDRDIKPWVGDRIAIAVRPAAGVTATGRTAAPEIVVAVEAKDDKQARTGLARITAAADQHFGVAFRGGYALLAERQDIADRAVADDGKGTLADNTQFRGDMKLLGGQGVSSGWADLAKLARLAGSSLPMASQNFGAQARLSYTVRFTSDSVEAVAKVIGDTSGYSAPAAGGPSIGDLPASTAVAVEVNGVDKSIDRGWKAFRSNLSQLGSTGSGPTPDDLVTQFSEEFGLTLPADLKVLFGSQLLVAVDFVGPSAGPRIAARARTDGAAAAAVLAKLRNSVALKGSSWPLTSQRTPDGIAVATSPDYLKTVLSRSGATLASDKNFRAAVPDAARPDVTAYANLDAIAQAMRRGGASADDLKAISAFRALGASSSTDNGVGTFRVRLLAH
jgi:hypothetical protein